MYNSLIYDSLEKINAKVELYEGSTSTLKKTCSCNDEVESFQISKEGDRERFFGFGICRQLKCTLIDFNNDIDIAEGDTIKIYFGSAEDDAWDRPFPKFYVTEIERDEKNDSINITAYDKLYQASGHTIEEVELPTIPYNLSAVATNTAAVLGLPTTFQIDAGSNMYAISFTEDLEPNYAGTEDLRTILNQIAEASQTIYFLDPDENLVFWLPTSWGTERTITKDEYFELSLKPAITLKAICSVTELGENIIAEDEAVTDGVTQYIRENPYLSLQEPSDVATWLDNAIAALGGLSSAQFSCDWAGDYRLQVIDRLILIASDGTEQQGFNYFSTISYTGSLGQFTEWEFTQDNDETAANSSKLGESLNQTFAKVDKANKQITLLATDVTAKHAATESELSTIKENQTSLTQTATDITLRVESIETDGVTRVDTGTGFTFDEEGLRINKDNSGIENLIDNTGMYVNQDGMQVLSANEEGVKAKDLHAVTYLWIGSHSRFEDYEGGRTGCFWIGE